MRLKSSTQLSGRRPQINGTSIWMGLSHDCAMATELRVPQFKCSAPHHGDVRKMRGNLVAVTVPRRNVTFACPHAMTLHTYRAPMVGAGLSFSNWMVREKPLGCYFMAFYSTQCSHRKSVLMRLWTYVTSPAFGGGRILSNGWPTTTTPFSPSQALKLK